MSAEDIKSAFANSSEDTPDDNQQCDYESPIGAMPSMNGDAYFGILQKFVDAAAINSEASPVAIAANVISLFCASLNRYVYQWIGDTKIHCRPFFLLVGKSGKARKGTAEALPRRVFERIDQIRSEKYENHLCLKIHGGGLSSGEGICFAIRDAPEDPDAEDKGVLDKRLLVIESEFANVLANCKRETSTLSAVIRNVFDGRNLAPLTKTSRTCATDPHVVIIGHITSHELIAKVCNGVEAANGLLNRFLMCFVAREQLVPLPVSTSTREIDFLAQDIVGIFDFIDEQRQKSISGTIEIQMNEQAQQYWVKVYSKLSQDNPGIVGSLLARTEVYARMLAMIFAVLDKKLVIEIVHLKAALHWVAYVEESVWHLFSDVTEQVKEQSLGDFAEKIFLLLANRGPMTRTEISKAFSGHKTSEIKEGLERLLNQAPARVEQIKEKTTGRSKEIYKVKEAKKAKKAT